MDGLVGCVWDGAGGGNCNGRAVPGVVCMVNESRVGLGIVALRGMNAGRTVCVCPLTTSHSQLVSSGEHQMFRLRVAVADEKWASCLMW